MSENKNPSKKQLLDIIYEASFAVDDVLLFLDTHPDCEEAKEYFDHFSEIRNKALKEFAKCYYPLTVDTASVDCKWKWTNSPWPWEGGC